MAVLSDYTSGTITVTQNSVNFTGTNTLWRTAQFREGDTVQLKGYTAIIAAASAADPRIASNTAGTFTEPWPGPSGTFAYRMRFTPDGARVTAQTTTLIELLGNGNLQALAGLTSAANKGVMFTGPGAAGTFDLSPFARTFLDDTTGAAVWTTLGGVTLDGANSGYVRLPDTRGTIIQRGVYWTGNGTTVTFPMAFPNAVRMVLATISQRPNGDTPLIAMTGNESLTGFTAHTRNSSSGALVTATIYWEAWGH